MKSYFEKRSKGTPWGRAHAPLVALLALNCSAEGQSVDELGSSRQAILNGDTVLEQDNPGIVAVYHQYIRPCSGSLIRRQWVLTSRHCLTDDGLAFGQLIDKTNLDVTRAVAPGLTVPSSGTSKVLRIVDHSSIDLALLQIDPPIEKPMGLWNGSSADLVGEGVHAMGYGRFFNLPSKEDETAGDSGAGVLRGAWLSVFAYQAPLLLVSTNASNQAIIVGDSGGAIVRYQDTLGRNIPGVAGVNTGSAVAEGSNVGDLGSAVAMSDIRGWLKRKMFVPGDYTGDGRSDIVLTGPVGWNTVPIAIGTTTQGSFYPLNRSNPEFAAWSTAPRVKAVSGDFDGDLLADVALLGPDGWNSIPIAFSRNNGTTFENTNEPSAFAEAAALAQNVLALAGDFNGDGRSDLAMTGDGDWNSIQVAFSNGDGTFEHWTPTTPYFPGWATNSGAKALSGDFDGDGRDDIALAGPWGWKTIPVAYTNDDGRFSVANHTAIEFGTLAPVSTPVVGDFDGDGRDDLALLGPFNTIPMAFSNGGSFSYVGSGSIDPVFLSFIATAGARPVVGDFNADGIADIALTGPNGWTSIPVAFGAGDRSGDFSYTNLPVVSFGGWAADPGAQPVNRYRF